MSTKMGRVQGCAFPPLRQKKGATQRVPRRGTELLCGSDHLTRRNLPTQVVMLRMTDFLLIRVFET
jgi:hypothetical protein